jgi:catechol 2,3-dioxygenase-like lactoylglutathione lyase family enzyme
MQLDHVTIITPDIGRLRDFFVDIAGMSDGPRPAFGIPGHWLYLDGRAVVHLVAGAALAAGQAPTRIDHVALRVDSADEWQALQQRLRRSGTPFQAGAISSLRQQQLFVELAPGAAIEFIHTQQA